MTTTTGRLAALAPDRASALRWAVVLNAEGLLALLYAARPDVTVYDPVVLAIPFVWLNVALLAVTRTEIRAPTPRRRAIAAGVGVAYFAVLAVIGGLVSVGGVPAEYAAGFGVNADLPPGWGPMVNYTGTAVAVTLMPYKVVGYATLAYLVAGTVADAAGSAVSGFVGLFSCVSCTWPVLGTVLAGTLGASSAVAVAVADAPYLASTLVFCSAVALLVWRPTLS